MEEKRPEIIRQIELGETTVGKEYGELKKEEAETPDYYVISNNLNRRHLNESQRGLIASRIANLSIGVKKADRPIGLSQEDASELMHVGCLILHTRRLS